MAVPVPTEFLVKHLDDPDDTKTFDHGKVDIVKFDDVTVKRATLQPGWRWSDDIGPMAGTDTCQQPHAIYVAEGQIGVKMDDGTEAVLEAGDTAVIPPGHDGWVQGDSTAVYIDFA